MKKKSALKVVLFLVLTVVILVGIYKVMVSHDDYRNYQWIAGFYEEEENTLDVVYIGGSNTYAFWESPIAWKEYGITVYPFACNSQPLLAAEYLIKEARKTQPDALYVVSINGIGDSVSGTQIHYLTDYMPYSANRFALINKLCELGDIPLSERMEFYFPLVLYHSRWNELSEDDFHYTSNGLKGGSTYNAFLGTVTDVSSSWRSTSRCATLSDPMLASLESLLDYCDSEGVEVLFVTAPQARTNESDLATFNAINSLVESRGYTYLNMLEHMDEIGLDLTTDYYNASHTNIHGALKTTDYLAKYLVENYSIKGKREEDGYEDWDFAYDEYLEIISTYALDIETSFETRDYNLAAPTLSSVSVNGTTLTLKWKESEGAEGYYIYRKSQSSAWEFLAETDADTTQYKDKECVKNTTYTYTVVPYRSENGMRIWGKFDVKGISGKALLSAPSLVSVEEIDEGVLFTWKKVNGADGYKVYRKLPGKSWCLVENVGDTDSYVDTTLLDNVPYFYSVRAYVANNNDLESTVDGSYNTTGILYLPKLDMPEVTVLVDGSIVTLSWDAAEGMTGYNVYRRTESSDWVLVAETLPADSVVFTDITVQATGKYAYKIEAFFKNGSDTYAYELNNAFEWIDVEKSYLNLEAPEIVYIRSDLTGVSIVWEPQIDATAYRIYRKADGDDEWSILKSSVSTNTYVDGTIECGKYSYLIQSLYTNSNYTFLGVFDTEKTSEVYCD